MRLFASVTAPVVILKPENAVWTVILLSALGEFLRGLSIGAVEGSADRKEPPGLSFP